MDMLLRIAPVLFVLLWSSGFIGTKLAVAGAEPFTFLSIRFALVLAVLVPVAYIFSRGGLRPEQRLRAFGAGVLLHGGYLGGITWGVSAGMDANVTALICALQPILTAIFAGLLLGEAITGRHWMGLALGLAGTILVIGPKFGPGGIGGTSIAGIAGIASVMLAVLSITAGTIYQKRYATGIELLPGAVWQFIGAITVLAPLCFLFETRHVIWSPGFVFALFWLVFVLSLGAITLLMVLIRENAVSRTSALFYLVPSVTSVMAFAIFGETLSLVQIAGFAIVTFAVIWMQAPAVPPPPSQS
ncbi:MAG: DMT family transporter [Hyphomicrobiaceae bacterium]|nr:DMT family transporter [Hyphomicrobiaceae bacterium]